MPSWESITYLCTNTECLFEKDDLIDKQITDRDAPIPCPECDSEMKRKLTANITRTTYVDGTKRKGWQLIRDRRSLDKNLRSLRQKQRIHGIDPGTEKEIVRLKQEKAKMRK